VLIQTDQALFQMLRERPLYQRDLYDDPDTLAYTPDSTPRVVRWGSSEYVDLLKEHEVTEPFVSVSFLREDNETGDRHYVAGGRGVLRSVDASGDDVASIRYPTPVNVHYQLDIRSPHDLWLRQIETEIQRRFVPELTVGLRVRVLGPSLPPEVVPVRFYVGSPQRLDDLSVFENERLLRSALRVMVESWLFPGSDALRMLKTVKTTEIEIIDTDDELLDEFEVSAEE